MCADVAFNPRRSPKSYICIHAFAPVYAMKLGQPARLGSVADRDPVDCETRLQQVTQRSRAVLGPGPEASVMGRPRTARRDGAARSERAAVDEGIRFDLDVDRAVRLAHANDRVAAPDAGRST